MTEQAQAGEAVEIPAGEARLSGRFFPAMGRARAHLLLSGGTGVPQGYYAPFARWASMQGIGVLTYDYRDFGESLHGPLSRSRATFADWTVRDQAAAEARLAALAPDGPLWLLGHSAGGLGLPFRKRDRRVERVTTVGAGAPYFMDHPWSYRPLVLAFWFVTGPPAVALTGRLPGRAMGLGADIPAGVYWQWRRWCTRREFFLADVGASLPEPDYGLMGAGLAMLTMEDDVVVPPVAVKRYVDLFPDGPAAYRVLRPAEFGLESLGHIQVFSARNAAAWSALL